MLSELIINIHNQAYKNKNDYLPKGLKSVGQKLSDLTKAFLVVRPQEVLVIAKELPEKITQSYSDTDNLSKAKPFKSLLDKITDIFTKFSIDDTFFSVNGINAQAEIIKFYLETKQYQQAVTLSRELIVSKVCAVYTFDMLTQREQAENLLNNTVRNDNPFLQLTEQGKKFADVWQNLGNIRNDINHAGMRENPIPAKNIIQQVKELCNKTIELVRER